MNIKMKRDDYYYCYYFILLLLLFIRLLSELSTIVRNSRRILSFHGLCWEISAVALFGAQFSRERERELSSTGRTST
jgi:hypothetical protein